MFPPRANASRVTASRRFSSHPRPHPDSSTSQRSLGEGRVRAEPSRDHQVKHFRDLDRVWADDPLHDGQHLLGAVE